MQCLEAAIERRTWEGLELELFADDRIGLLSDITRIFHENSLRIKRAEISTICGKARDTLHVADLADNPLDLKIIDSIRRQVGPSALQVKHNLHIPPQPAQAMSVGFLFGNFFRAQMFQNFKLIRPAT